MMQRPETNGVDAPPEDAATRKAREEIETGPMLFRRGTEKNGVSAIYLAILSAIILIILIITGFMEINRTREVYLLLQREASSSFSTSRKYSGALGFLQQLGKKTGTPADPSDSGFYYGLEESAGEYLVEAAIM